MSDNYSELDDFEDPKNYIFTKEASKYKEIKSIKEEDFEKISKKICDIKIDNINGIGFFCQIPDPDNKNYTIANNIKVLFTCYHVANLKEINTIKYKFLTQEKEINVKEKERRKWYSKDYDYSCIEILEKDKIDENDCLNIDENIEFDNYTKENLLDKVVYIFKTREVSIGNIKYIHTINLIYNNDTKEGWSGSPVICKDNNKVIAIHKEGIKSNDDNKGKKEGTFLGNQGILLKYILKHMREKSEKDIKFKEKWKKK